MRKCLSPDSKYEDPIKRASGRHFSGNVPTREGHDELYTHLFRSVYAVIAAHWYCPPTVNELDFRAAIQGHFEILNDPNQSHRLNLMSQRHYWDYQISDGNDNIDGRLGIKLGEPGIEVLERFLLASSKAATPSSHRAIAFEASANNTVEAIANATERTTDGATDGATNRDVSLSADAISKSASDSTPVLSDNNSTSTLQQPLPLKPNNDLLPLPSQQPICLPHPHHPHPKSATGQNVPSVFSVTPANDLRRSPKNGDSRS